MWSSRVGEVCIVLQYKVGMEGRVTDLLVSQGIGRWRGGADKFERVGIIDKGPWSCSRGMLTSKRPSRFVSFRQRCCSSDHMLIISRRRCSLHFSLEPEYGCVPSPY